MSSRRTYVSWSATRLLLLATALILTGRPFTASAEPATDLQTLLEAAGWPSARLERIAGQSELTPEDEAELIKLTNRMRRYDQLVTAVAAEESGLAARIRGEVVHAEKVPLLKKTAELVGAPAYFHCVIELTEGDNDALHVYALHAPQAWLGVARLRQPVEATGIRLGKFFITPRVHWYPQQTDGDLVNFGESLLGSMGFDVGLLELAADGSPILPREHNLFYELLATMKEAGARQLARFAKGNLSRYAATWRPLQETDRLAQMILSQAEKGRYSIAPLFNDALGQRGQLFVFDGLVRRAVRVEVGTGVGSGKEGPSPTVQRFGIDHYYELELFTEDSQNLPLVFCVLDLPEGFPEGDSIAQEARLAGFFLKRWAYRTRKPSAGLRSHDKGQLAPLLFGRAPIPLAPVEGDQSQASLLMGLGFVALLLATCWMVWRFSQSDREFDEKIRPRLEESTERVDFAELAHETEED